MFVSSVFNLSRSGLAKASITQSTFEKKTVKDNLYIEHRNQIPEDSAIFCLMASMCWGVF